MVKRHPIHGNGHPIVDLMECSSIWTTLDVKFHESMDFYQLNSISGNNLKFGGLRF